MLSRPRRPYIKWFLERLGHKWMNTLLAGFDDSQAYAQTIIAFSPGPGKQVHFFDGRTEGRVVPARGAKDFGRDPIFEPMEEEQSGERKTYAEMTKDEKNAISHRGRAFQKFRELTTMNQTTQDSNHFLEFLAQPKY